MLTEARVDRCFIILITSFLIIIIVIDSIVIVILIVILIAILIVILIVIIRILLLFLTWLGLSGEEVKAQKQLELCIKGEFVCRLSCLVFSFCVN